MKYFVTVNGREIEVEVDGERAIVSGRRLAATLHGVPGTPLRHLVIDGRSTLLPVEPRGSGQWAVSIAGERHDVAVVDERTRYIRSLTASGEQQRGPSALKAPMPGLVVRVQVEAGQRVAAGDPVLVLEAMKMENQLKAPAPGVVSVVAVSAGEAVEKGKVLVEFAPAVPPLP